MHPALLARWLIQLSTPSWDEREIEMIRKALEMIENFVDIALFGK